MEEDKIRREELAKAEAERREAERLSYEQRMEDARIQREKEQAEFEARVQTRREEEAAAAESRRQEDERRYNVICRAVSYIQDRITESATLELQKELLSYHSNFDSYTVFRSID